MNNRKIQVSIVDDDFRTIENLKKLLNYTGKIEVSSTYQSAFSFFNDLSNMSENDLPDLVLMDIDMEEMSGIDCVLIGKAKYPEIHFLMLTVYDDEDKLFQSIKAGANGYLLKDEKISVVVSHIENLVYHGEVPLSPRMAQKTFDLLRQSELETKSLHDSFELSDREKQVLQLMVDGKDYKEIALALFISKNTVKKHIANIYSKLHVSSKAQAIKMVHFHKLLG